MLGLGNGINEGCLSKLRVCFQSRLAFSFPHSHSSFSSNFLMFALIDGFSMNFVGCWKAPRKFFVLGVSKLGRLCHVNFFKMVWAVLINLKLSKVGRKKYEYLNSPKFVLTPNYETQKKHTGKRKFVSHRQSIGLSGVSCYLCQ